MIQTAADHQSKLLSIINELFSFIIDPYSGKKVIRVNPKLNDDLLQKAVEKTRRLIVNLYVTCENDYVNGVKLYEAIVESKILETTQKQIQSLKAEASKIIQETKKASMPVKEAPLVNPPPLVNPLPLVNPPPVVIAMPSSTTSLPSSSTSLPSSTTSSPSSMPSSSTSSSSTSLPSSSTSLPSSTTSSSTTSSSTTSTNTLPSTIPTPPTMPKVNTI